MGMATPLGKKNIKRRNGKRIKKEEKGKQKKKGKEEKKGKGKSIKMLLFRSKPCPKKIAEGFRPTPSRST